MPHEKKIQLEIESACYFGNTEELEKWITPENVNWVDDKGMTPLMHAATSPCTDAIPFLLQKGAKIDFVPNEGLYKGVPAVWIAASFQQWKTLEALIKFGTRHIDAAPSEGGNAGKTPFLLAALFGDVDSMKLLLSKGASFTHRTPKQETALLLAARNHQFPAAQFLVENGADLFAKCADGNNALMILANNTNPDTQFARFLLDQGIPYNDTNGSQFTAREIARMHQSKGVYELLNTVNKLYREFMSEESDADFDFNSVKEVSQHWVDARGRTPLHWAVRLRNEKSILWCLINGADIDAKDKNGKTPFDFAKDSPKQRDRYYFALGQASLASMPVKAYEYFMHVSPRYSLFDAARFEMAYLLHMKRVLVKRDQASNSFQLVPGLKDDKFKSGFKNEAVSMDLDEEDFKETDEERKIRQERTIEHYWDGCDDLDAQSRVDDIYKEYASFPAGKEINGVRRNSATVYTLTERARDAFNQCSEKDKALAQKDQEMKELKAKLEEAQQQYEKERQARAKAEELLEKESRKRKEHPKADSPIPAAHAAPGSPVPVLPVPPVTFSATLAGAGDEDGTPVAERNAKRQKTF